MLRGHFLGGFRLTVGDVEIAGLTTRKSRSLLAYLMLNPNRAFGRETLAETIWGDGRAGDTMKALRQELWLIRKAFRAADVAPEDHFVFDGEDLGAVATPWVDAAKFEAALETPAATGPKREPEPGALLDDAGVARIEAATAFYAGDLLPGLYEDWCLLPREILRDKYIIAVERLMSWHASRADWGTAIIHGKRLLAADPLLEHIHRDVMRFHYARGDRAAALRQFARCKRVLRKELTIDPMAETVALYEAIRSESEVAWDDAADGRCAESGRPHPLLGQHAAMSALGAIRDDLDDAGRRIEAIMRGNVER